MNETHVKELLSGYMDHALTSDETTRVEKHLAGCPTCQTYLAEIKGLVSWMKKVPPAQARAGLDVRLLNRLKAQRAPSRPWILSGSVATVILGVFVFVMVRENVPQKNYQRLEEIPRPVAAAKLKNEILSDKINQKQKTGLKKLNKESMDQKLDRPQAPEASFQLFKAKDELKAQREDEGQTVGALSQGIRSLRKMPGNVVRGESEWPNPYSKNPVVDFSKDMAVICPNNGQLVSKEFKKENDVTILVIKYMLVDADQRTPRIEVMPMFNGPVRFEELQ